MFTLLILWVLRGGDSMAAPLRTLADVEADIRLRGRMLHDHRARRGETVNRRERIAGEPREDVDRLNELIDERAMLTRVPARG